MMDFAPYAEFLRGTVFWKVAIDLISVFTPQDSIKTKLKGVYGLIPYLFRCPTTSEMPHLSLNV